MKKINLLSIAVSTGSYEEFIESIMLAARNRISQYTCVANVHMLVEAHNDHAFGTLVKNAHIITPDGKPLAWALRLLYGIKQERVAGMDLLPDLLKAAAAQKFPVFFYGGTNELLENTGIYVKANHPQLHTAGFYSPPFRALTMEEDEAVIKRINDSGARLVFVVLGCPKQERWMANMHGRIHAVTIGVGGALPVMIGMQQRAPRWMQTAGMEWLFRLAQEPGRLFRRYAITNTTFIYLLFKEYFKTRLARKEPQTEGLL